MNLTVIGEHAKDDNINARFDYAASEIETVMSVVDIDRLKALVAELSNVIWDRELPF